MDTEHRLEELVRLLEHEESVVADLHRRVVAVQHLVATGELRHLARAVDEVEQALDAVRETEVLRAIIVNEIARDAGLTHDATLSAIVELAPEPLAGQLRQCERRLAAWTADIEVAGSRTRLAADSHLDEVEHVGALLLGEDPA